jgi:glutathione synthase/RimK-type ligase-like ATP-grasp enzyme
MILLWGDPEDPPIHQVHEALQRLSEPVFLLDSRRLEDPDHSPRLEDVTAAYLRPTDISGDLDHASLRKAAHFTERLFTWAELTDAKVVNRPRAMAANHSKPFQLSRIRLHGFEVPDTIITTDPEWVLEFWNGHGKVIYKSTSGVRSIVAQLRPEDRERLADIVWCPTQFQEYVEGCDFRVHVVGREVYACMIVCDADDYRYAALQDRHAAIYACDLPDDLSQRCVDMVSAMGLEFGGVDLRRTPDSRWYCFEVNPSPGFTYFSAHSGQPIAHAVATLLASSAKPSRS